MAIIFVNAGTFAQSGSLIGTTGQLADVPTNVVDDDFLIIFSFRHDDPGSFDALAGWTEQTELGAATFQGIDRTNVIYTRVASSEPSDYTVTHSDTDAEEWSTVMLAFRGVNTTTSLDVVPVKATHFLLDEDQTSTTSDRQNKAIITVTNGAWVVIVNNEASNHITSGAAPTNYDLRINEVGTSRVNRQIQIATREITTAGTETPGVWVNSVNNTTADANLATLALRPSTTIGFHAANRGILRGLARGVG